MKSIFKKVESKRVVKVDEGIRPSLRGKYANMMRDIYTIYQAYVMDEGARPESEGAVRQMIFDQAMSQFENHDPIIRLPAGRGIECELDMRQFSVEQLAEIAEKIRTGGASESLEPSDKAEKQVEPDAAAVDDEEKEDEEEDDFASGSESVFGDLRKDLRK